VVVRVVRVVRLVRLVRVVVPPVFMYIFFGLLTIGIGTRICFLNDLELLRLKS
jgi:hypothetical protein